MRIRLGVKRFRRERTGKESRKKDENLGNAEIKLAGRKKEQTTVKEKKADSAVFLAEHVQEMKGSGWLMHFSMYLRQWTSRTPSLLGKQLQPALHDRNIWYHLLFLSNCIKLHDSEFLANC